MGLTYWKLCIVLLVYDYNYTHKRRFVCVVLCMHMQMREVVGFKNCVHVRQVLKKQVKT